MGVRRREDLTGEDDGENVWDSQSRPERSERADWDMLGRRGGDASFESSRRRIESRAKAKRERDPGPGRNARRQPKGQEKRDPSDKARRALDGDSRWSIPGEEDALDERLM